MTPAAREAPTQAFSESQSRALPWPRKRLLASRGARYVRRMPGPIHFTPPPQPPTLASAQGASYVQTPDWKPGQMAPPPAYQYAMPRVMYAVASAKSPWQIRTSRSLSAGRYIDSMQTLPARGLSCYDSPRGDYRTARDRCRSALRHRPTLRCHWSAISPWMQFLWFGAAPHRPTFIKGPISGFDDH